MITASSVAPVHELPMPVRWRAGATFSPEGAPAGSTRVARPARVLVVEDDYFVAMEIESTLEELRCDVVGIAATGEEALELADRERPELVLMDIRLAGSLDGVETAAMIYERFAIRCLFVTAHSDPHTRIRAQRANPVGWAGKPFTSQQLTTAITDALAAVGSKR